MKYLTVVYAINDDAAFADHKKIIDDNFSKAHGKPWAVEAISVDHEIRRVELIELANGDIDKIDYLLSYHGVGDL